MHDLLFTASHNVRCNYSHRESLSDAWKNMSAPASFGQRSLKCHQTHEPICSEETMVVCVPAGVAVGRWRQATAMTLTQGNLHPEAVSLNQ